MSYLNELEKYIKNSGGMILTKEVDNLGIPRHYISILVKEGKLERVSRGVYITPDVFDDQMYRIQQRNSKVIYSHETALYFHNLTDRDPNNYNVTVPSGYNASHLKKEELVIYTVKKELFDLGTTKTKTIYGREITVYNKERTICDLVRNRNNVDIAILNEAFRRYVGLKDKNIPQLLSYAKQLNVLKVVRKYLEILLWKI